MSSFGTTPYQVTILLASPQAPDLWEWESWRSLVAPLTPLLTSTRGRTFLRMHQKINVAGGTPNQNDVRFGQLGWNERSHQKWTHGSPVTAGQSDNWSFLSTTIWSPGPGACEDIPPDGFLACANECTSNSVERNECQFAYSVLVAARLDLDGAQARLAAAIAPLRNFMNPILVATTERSWDGGKCLRTGERTGSLTDALTLGLFRSGPRHNHAPSIDLLVGKWRAENV